MIQQLKKNVDILDDLLLVFWHYLSPDFKAGTVLVDTLYYNYLSINLDILDKTLDIHNIEICYYSLPKFAKN